MRVQDIVLGEYHRLKNSPNYGYIKPIEILKPNEKENKGNNYIVIKCEHTVSKNESFGFIRYFRPRDIIKD